MSRVLICIPTIDKVDASFFRSVLGMRYNDGNDYSFTMRSNSLIYFARGDMATEAINGKYDWMVSLDSDMVMEPDTVMRLVASAQGKDFVTGLYFKRRLPTMPLILRALDWYEHEQMGPQEVAETYEDYPRDDVFRIAGCGFGCCVARVEMIKEMAIRYRMNPWTPLPRLSEDYSFCFRAKQMGYEMWCDSRIRPGHAGLHVYTQGDWDIQRRVIG